MTYSPYQPLLKGTHFQRTLFFTTQSQLHSYNPMFNHSIQASLIEPGLISLYITKSALVLKYHGKKIPKDYYVICDISSDTKFTNTNVT
jgi:hypothetical protein